jgi:hypothetical protein
MFYQPISSWKGFYVAPPAIQGVFNQGYSVTQKKRGQNSLARKHTPTSRNNETTMDLIKQM